MKVRYKDLIEQTFDFPQEEFSVDNNHKLSFHGIPLQELIQKHGTPLKISYLPKISENIKKAKMWFHIAMLKADYKGTYNYCYCTKSSHFHPIIKEALKNDIHIETSSNYDIEIIKRLFKNNEIDTDRYILCNGYKTLDYCNNIAELIHLGFKNTIPIIDNQRELNDLQNATKESFNIGIRIASEEEPKFAFYTSRLGIGYKDIVPYYLKHIKDNPKIKLKMLHFFINTGIKDDAYYWNELIKCLNVYISLKKVCPELDSLNIGGGFPIKNSLGFNYDYPYMCEEIISQIKKACKEEKVSEPNIFTEFGSFTVGESGAFIVEVIDQKLQNDKERWNMINSSFMTNLPDSWAVNQRFVLLPINRWDAPYERVLLGGLTCDSDDFYNSEQHVNAIHLPHYKKNEPLYLGFFNTGAYQDSIGGFGGIQHCLIPNPKYILVDLNDEGELVYNTFSEKQSSESMLNLLGY